MTVLELKPHHERIAAIYKELKAKTPEGKRISWSNYLADHPEVREELGLGLDSESVLKLRGYVNDYIVRLDPEHRLIRQGRHLGSIKKSPLAQHHERLKQIYDENKDRFKRFQWVRLFNEHPEYLEQLGLPPLTEYDDKSHPVASKLCSEYVSLYLNPRPSKLKTKPVKNIPPSRKAEYVREYQRQYSQRRKMLNELAAKTNAALETRTETAQKQTEPTPDPRRLHYCPNCGCELRAY